MQFGCQRRSEKWTPSKSFKTQIIISRSFGTEFQLVELEGIKNKSTLFGDIADFYFAPTEKNGTLIGSKPLARFIEDDGVFIPADQISLQMVTLYYHFQQLKKLELEALNSEQSILKWPRKIALAVQVVDAPDMRFDNAFYNGKVDAYYFVPYREKQFPIPLNLGIIAHEHFHSYFYNQVLNPLFKKNKLVKKVDHQQPNEQKIVDDQYNLYLLKIVNEGLADVWGWIYSNDPDFVAVSLPKVGSTRNLEKGSHFQERRLVEALDLKNEIRLMNQCKQIHQECSGDNSYLYGTILARTLKSFASARQKAGNFSDQSIRSLIASKVFKLIADIQIVFSENTNFDLDQVLLLWEKQFDSLSSSECQTLQAAVSSSGVLKCSSSINSSVF